ncbi:DUF1853 family protein [Maribacter sp. HTCC2170]|uniref:DUF1853 family protein n=1 Tax=Maribacter sp. (strain HTCC2170 / KCCM 42371) TaxID=313603 RepID=UPI00006AFC73|nr:DUF1853 family protein [Maribacter sp. HTCC2170]EAR01269.1 hypothetical protein FB2170_11131 [Maribacter sp. HTCC2170]
MPQENHQGQFFGFLNTPPLWEKEQFGIQQFDFPDLDLASFVPSHIPNTIRLGHQMEYVFKQLMEQSETYDLLLHNLPIKREKRTIGEIDFVLKEQTSEKLTHVELTYKFYIIDPEVGEAIHQLIGPNKLDSFFAKMQKIKHKQFTLLHAEDGVKALEQHAIDHTQIEHQCCYKAQLFKPYGESKSNINPLNNLCIVGFWLGFETFRGSDFQHYEFYIPNKSSWVIAPHNDVEWSNHSEINTAIQLQMFKENSPMVWMKKSETEFEKFFVVWWD